MKLRITKDIPGYKKGDVVMSDEKYPTDGLLINYYKKFYYNCGALIKDGYADEVKEECCNLPRLPDGSCSCSCHSEKLKPQKPSERIAELRETIRMPYQENWKILVEIQSIIHYLDEIHENK